MNHGMWQVKWELARLFYFKGLGQAWEAIVFFTYRHYLGQHRLCWWHIIIWGQFCLEPWHFWILVSKFCCGCILNPVSIGEHLLAVLIFVELWPGEEEKFIYQSLYKISYLRFDSSASFRSISSFSIWFAFSRHKTLSLIWFSLILRESRDFLAARLFFLLLSQYLSSLFPKSSWHLAE